MKRSFKESSECWAACCTSTKHFMVTVMSQELRSELKQHFSSERQTTSITRISIYSQIMKNNWWYKVTQGCRHGRVYGDQSECFLSRVHWLKQWWMKGFKGFNSLHLTVHLLWFLYETNENYLVEFFYWNHQKECASSKKSEHCRQMLYQSCRIWHQRPGPKSKFIDYLENLKNSNLKRVDMEERSGSKAHGDVVLWSVSKVFQRSGGHLIHPDGTG